MPVPTPPVLPLDPTGLASTNFIEGELHVMPARSVRCVATSYGPFFTESLVVRDNATDEILTKDTQYSVVQLAEIPSAKYGKEICHFILVKDPTVSATVALEYQAIGGPYGTSNTALQDLINTLELDERPVSWPDILNRPDAFPPSHHLHDAGDIYGFEEVCYALERIRQAILVGDDIAHDAIYRWVTAQLAALDAITAAEAAALISASMAAHLAAADPHNQYVLKTDIGENVTTVNATTSTTILDLSTGTSMWIVNVSEDTAIQFANPPSGFISFGVITKNAVADKACAWPVGTEFAGGIIPPRTVTLNGKDEYWFQREASGAAFVGSLAVADARA